MNHFTIVLPHAATISPPSSAVYHGCYVHTTRYLNAESKNGKSLGTDCICGAPCRLLCQFHVYSNQAGELTPIVVDVSLLFARAYGLG